MTVKELIALLEKIENKECVAIYLDEIQTSLSTSFQVVPNAFIEARLGIEFWTEINSIISEGDK